ncbi:hypothetical protein [Saccharothrix syringae]|uniref:hypothetical protein n=1 Tax=Saccharothrix syringae TaxID=103733 RepID=UPI00052406E0|nr:hypothetical protein [Saccharothrix syringae]
MLEHRSRSPRRQVTLIAAVPVTAVAVLAAVFLENQGTRLEAAPLRETIMRVTAHVEPGGATGAHVPDPVRRRHCVNEASRVESGLLRTEDLVLGPEEVIRLGAAYHSVSYVPELSLWPFTDPYGIRHTRVFASDGELGPLPMPQESRRVDPKALDEVVVSAGDTRPVPACSGAPHAQ